MSLFASDCIASSLTEEKAHPQPGGQPALAASNIAKQQTTTCMGHAHAPVEKVHPVKLPLPTASISILQDIWG